MELRAYHGRSAIKQKYLKRVKRHRELDQLVQGQTGQNGRGCAVWCTLNRYEHAAYETELGIPRWLARVEDRLFEGMSARFAQKWPEQFLSAIRPGANLEQIKGKFLIYILRRALKQFDNVKYSKQADAIRNVIELYVQGETDPNKFIDRKSVV